MVLGTRSGSMSADASWKSSSQSKYMVAMESVLIERRTGDAGGGGQTPPSGSCGTAGCGPPASPAVLCFRSGLGSPAPRAPSLAEAQQCAPCFGALLSAGHGAGTSAGGARELQGAQGAWPRMRRRATSAHSHTCCVSASSVIAGPGFAASAPPSAQRPSPSAGACSGVDRAPKCLLACAHCKRAACVKTGRRDISDQRAGWSPTLGVTWCQAGSQTASTGIIRERAFCLARIIVACRSSGLTK